MDLVVGGMSGFRMFTVRKARDICKPPERVMLRLIGLFGHFSDFKTMDDVDVIAFGDFKVFVKKGKYVPKSSLNVYAF